MSTVIFRYLTRDGFAIVADGKSVDLEKQLTLKTNVQKIFEIPGQRAAYALLGSIRFDDDAAKLPSLDLAMEIERLVRSGAASLSDLPQVDAHLAQPLYELLLKAKAEGLITDYQGFSDFPNSGSTILRLFMFGYCNGTPCEIHIRFWHQDQVLGRPQLGPFDLRTRNPFTMGCPTIWNALRHNDPALSRFPFPSMPAAAQSQDISLWDAAKVGETLILACDSDEGHAMDADCKLIGGHIQIAAITPMCFHWLRPPILG